MRILKKIALFALFFVTLAQVMGNSTFRFQEQWVVVETNEHRNPSSASVSLDFDEIEDENSLNLSLSCYRLFILEKRIAGKGFQLDTSFNYTLWQPPKRS